MVYTWSLKCKEVNVLAYNPMFYYDESSSVDFEESTMPNLISSNSNYVRNFYDNIIYSQGYYYTTFFNTSNATTWKIYVYRSEDGIDWVDTNFPIIDDVDNTTFYEGRNATIVADSIGNIHLIYEARTQSPLYAGYRVLDYATQQWSALELLPNYNSYHYYKHLSIHVASDVVHVFGWGIEPTGNIIHLWKDGTWQYEFLLPTFDYRYDMLDVFKDSNNIFHLVYYYRTLSPTTYYCRYMYGTTGDWSSPETVSNEVNSDYYSFCVDSLNNVHLVSFDWTQADVIYINRISGVWSAPSVIYAGTYLEGVSLAIDTNNKLHLAFCHDGSIYYMNRVDSWSIPLSINSEYWGAKIYATTERKLITAGSTGEGAVYSFVADSVQSELSWKRVRKTKWLSTAWEVVRKIKTFT